MFYSSIHPLLNRAALTLAAIALAAPVVSAQNAGNNNNNSVTVRPSNETFSPPPYYGYGAMGGGGGFGGGWGFNEMGAGSTVGGSYMTGMGNAIRAQGQYNLLSSQAAINLEQAQKAAMENQLQWTNTYFEMRRINQANREAQKGPPRTPDDWVRMAANAAPQRLESNALDPVTGQLAWPPALQADTFTADRSELEKLFAERATSHGAVGLDTYNKIRNTVDAALAKLRGMIRDIDTRNYIQARNFLNGLAREADFPNG
jgi:hypothetical protein